MNYKKILFYIIQIILVILFIFSCYKIINWYLENEENKNTLIEVKQFVDNKIVEIIEDNNIVERDILSIDFDALSNINDDTVGYIKINNTKIEYPVVKTVDNDFYLNHSYNKNNNSAGFIFADYRNKLDGTDKNIIIYGHNRKDDSMFGSLDVVLTESWYLNSENHIIEFVTEEGYFEYQIFSIYTILAEDYYITTNFFNVDYANFLTTLNARSIYNFDRNLSDVEKIITLSTCDDEEISSSCKSD